MTMVRFGNYMLICLALLVFKKLPTGLWWPALWHGIVLAVLVLALDARYGRADR